jgi:hypothetical protein
VSILGNILGREVAVVVKDRLPLGIVVIKTARGPAVEQEIFVDEFHKNS